MTTQGPIHPRPNNRTYATVDMSTAADGLSESISLSGLSLAAIKMSTDWTDAHICIHASVGESTEFYDIYDPTGFAGAAGTDGNLSYTTTANRIITLNPAYVCGFDKIRLASETSLSVAVAQEAPRELTLVLSPYVGTD